MIMSNIIDKPDSNDTSDIIVNETSNQPTYITTSLQDYYSHSPSFNLPPTTTQSKSQQQQQLQHTNDTQLSITNTNQTTLTSDRDTNIQHNKEQQNNNIIHNNNTTTLFNDTFNNWETNSRDNVAYGDSINIKNDGILRIYYQNIHGIKKSNTWHDFQYSIPILHKWNVDIMAYSETNIQWREDDKISIKNLIKPSYQNCLISTSNSSAPSQSYYQQGGTCTITTNSFTGRVCENLSDTTGLGRWSGQRLRCGNSKHLSIITAYCPIIDTKYDSNTCYQQQWRLLNTDREHHIEPRHQMIHDLQTMISILQEQHDEIILMWDANGNLENNEINRMYTELNLYNLMPVTPDLFSSYMRGKRIIDHIWGTEFICTQLKQSGYLPFNGDAWSTDHRGMYIDLCINGLLHEKLFNTPLPNPRIITSNNKKNIKKFLDDLETNNDIQQMLDECDALNTISKWQPEHTAQLEGIDKNLTSMLLASEQKIITNSLLPWSPAMHTSFLIYTYWRKYNSSKKNRINIDKALKDIKHKLGDKVYMQQNCNKHPLQLLRLATKQWTQSKKDAYQLRQEHLYDRQELAIKNKNPEIAKIIANLRKRERINRAYHHIRTINKPNTSNGGLSYILIQDSNGFLQRIDDVDEMNLKLYHRNRIHFSQAHHTPCTMDTTVQHIGESGTTSTAQQILKGTIPLDINEDLQMIFQELQSQLPPIPLEFDFQDMLQGFYKWDERTTTSPSRRHLGIYKSLANAHKYTLRTTTEDRIAASTITSPTQPPQEILATKLLRIINKIINIAVRHSVVLSRWTVAHNFFLEKLPGQPLLDKLRVIHIFEADYNYISKLTLRQAVQHNEIAHEQAGGRPNRTAIDEAVRTTITYETCKLQRLKGGIMYNDAKACFDRIIENLSNMTCMNVGTPIEVLDLHHNTLRDMKYIIKHRYGLSTHVNGHNSPDPFYGVGQGAGDSCTRWGFISDAIIKAYNKRSHSARINSPISKIFSDHRVQAFVDDSRLFLIFQNHLSREIFEHLKEDVQLWEKLLYATGAKLELKKCKFLVFTWKFDADGNPSVETMTDASDMKIQDSESKHDIEVSSMQINESYKLLGVPVAFDGNSKAQTLLLTQQVNHLINVFRKTTLNHDDTYLGYKTVAIPKLNYPLPATTISSSSLRTLQNKLTYNILPIIGIHRNMPREIVHAPKYFGGLAFHDLEQQQSISHITSIIGHYRAATSLSQQYTQLIESYIVSSGMGRSPLQYPQNVSYVSSPWLEICIEFLQRTNTHIIIPHIQTIQLLREHDTYIMAHAQEWTQVTDVLHNINQCRYFLQVNNHRRNK